MIDEIKNDIKNADMVLAAVGSEFKVLTGEDILRNSTAEQYFAANEQNAVSKAVAELYCHSRQDITQLIQPYNELNKLLSDKNYFVITDITDGLICKSQLNPIRIVAPCGNMYKLQCQCEENGIIDIEGYQESIISSFEKALDVKNIFPVCPKCNCRYSLNVYNKEYYNETGYLKQWNLYNKWLQGTLNKRLVILELGVDFSYPSLTRWPFEKIVMINKNAKLVRVGMKFNQITKEVSDKMVSVTMNPREFVEGLL